MKTSHNFTQANCNGLPEDSKKHEWQIALNVYTDDDKREMKCLKCGKIIYASTKLGDK